MKISVVIPTYSRPDLLRKCLDALLTQTFSHNQYEVIVVSDGPDEATQHMVAKLQEEASCSLRFLFNEKRRGPAAARNVGWINSKSELIAFTDDDTIPDKNWLTNIWNNYRDEELLAFTGRVIVPVSSPPTDYEKNVYNLETAEFVTANCVCTKTALIRVGGFDERFRIAWREDSDLHFKLLENGIPIKKINAVVLHPVRQAPWGISIKEQKKGIFNALLYKKYPTLYRQRIQSQPAWNYYGMVIASIIVPIALLSGNIPVAVSAFLIWFFLQYAFIRKRLQSTSRSTDHVIEMVITSMVIPFASVYWQLYGAWKYRVLYL